MNTFKCLNTQAYYNEMFVIYVSWKKDFFQNTQWRLNSY